MHPDRENVGPRSCCRDCPAQSRSTHVSIRLHGLILRDPLQAKPRTQNPEPPQTLCTKPQVRDRHGKVSVSLLAHLLLSVQGSNSARQHARTCTQLSLITLRTINEDPCGDSCQGAAFQAQRVVVPPAL